MSHTSRSAHGNSGPTPQGTPPTPATRRGFRQSHSIPASQVRRPPCSGHLSTGARLASACPFSSFHVPWKRSSPNRANPASSGPPFTGLPAVRAPAMDTGQARIEPSPASGAAPAVGSGGGEAGGGDPGRQAPRGTRDPDRAPQLHQGRGESCGPGGAWAPPNLPPFSTPAATAPHKTTQRASGRSGRRTALAAQPFWRLGGLHRAAKSEGFGEGWRWCTPILNNELDF